MTDKEKQPPGGGPDERAGEQEETEPTLDLTRITSRIRGPLGFTATATGIILCIVVLAAAKLGQMFLLPIVLAVVLNFLLAPAVRFLGSFGLPNIFSAALVLLVLLGSVGYGFYRLSGPASEWVEKAPQTLRRAEYRFRGLQKPVEDVQKAAKQVDELTKTQSDEPESQQVTVRGPTMSESLMQQTRSALAGGTLMLFLTFFMLASGDLFLRKLARVLPQFHQRRNAVAIAKEIEVKLSRYLFTMTTINLGLGAAVAAAMWLLDMPNPLLWGVMAGVLNFVPYIGPLVGIVVTGLVAFVTFDTTGQAVVIPLVYLALNGLEGYLVTPFIVGKRLTLNPVAILVGIMFWGWLWGIPGALLAVPLVVSLKIICDQIELLAPLGEFLGA